jgi:hypothetical protein
MSIVCRMSYGDDRLTRQAGEIDSLLLIECGQSQRYTTVVRPKARSRKRTRSRNYWTEQLCHRDTRNYTAVAPKRDKKPFSVESENIDPLSNAKARGQEYRQKSIKESFSSKEVMNILKISEQDLNRLCQSNQIVFLEDENRYVYPKCQFFLDKIIDGIDRVIKELPIKDGWTQLIFLESEDPSLQGDRPIDRLQKGDISSVVIAAGNDGRQRPY